ncbi:hypothetical protein KR093_008387 [Drosophila rubida]|uniref:Uncharacterized protein n=1 Tax=Drosophila rubida TaxID=30044 RepID=A0AAD4PI62_9MUSC|nr:hypothetical protein KR093_008387 [Drosophila rubida]
MVAPSKVFEPPFNRFHCASIIHSLPHHGCTQDYIWNIYRNHLCCYKYYLPLLLGPLLLHCYQLNRKRVWAIVRNYLETTSVSAIINATTYYLMCIFRRLNGRFVWAFTPFMSSTLATTLIWLASPKTVQYYTNGVMHASVETMLRQLDLVVVHSQAARTLVFMLCSALVLCWHQAYGFSNFWFIKPAKLPQDYHERSLQQRLIDGLLELRMYLGVGLGLDLLSTMMSRKTKKIDLKTTRFVVSYMGMYKLLQCLLIDKMNLKHTNLIAAFLSGSVFWFVKKIPLAIMSYGVVAASQVLWKQFCALDASKSQLLAALQCIPWTKLLIPPSLAYLVHSNVFQREIMNELAKSFIDKTCENK